MYITTKISEIDELQKHLKALVEITREKCLFEWKNHLHSQEDFKNCNFVVNTDDKYPNIYVVLEYKGKSFAAAIEYYRLNNEIYFGLGRHFSSQTLNEEIKFFFNDFLKDREFESNDRNRVSAFARLYGYESDKHPGMNSLYITIGSEMSPQNNQNFYLDLNESDRTVEIRRHENDTSQRVAYWYFEDLEKELHLKHPATLWVKAESKMNGDIAEFKYTEAELTRSPQFMTFISLIKLGVVTYDWRGYTSKEGKYEGKNHGNAWRVKNKHRNQLFGSSEVIELI